MDPFLAWIEEGPFSIFLRESDYGFSGSLIAHVIGVALVAGPGIVIALRLLGYLPGVPAAALRRFAAIGWLGLLVSVPSGLLLVVAYPTKALTNPLFYFKIAAILAFLWAMWRIGRVLSSSGLGDTATTPLAARLAGLSLGLSAFTIAAGRLLAYTYSRLMIGF